MFDHLDPSFELYKAAISVLCFVQQLICIINSGHFRFTMQEVSLVSNGCFSQLDLAGD